MSGPPSHPSDLTEQIFGWNPYAGRDPAKVQPLPEWASANHEIEKLTDLYQQQLAELVAAHNLLLNDQESLASMLAPFVGSDGKLVEAPDEVLLLMKKGLDFRLQEFEEDCRRLQQTERKLQRKIDACTLTYETSMIEAKGYADTKLVEQIYEQQRLIEYQQHELDELRFQRDLYSDELFRLRQLCRFGEFKPGGQLAPKREAPLPSPRTLHREYSAAQPPFGWMREIKHARRGEQKPRLHKPQGRSVTRIPPDRPFTTTTGPQERRAPSRTPSRAPPPEQEITSTGGLFGLIGDVLGGPSKVEAKEPSALLGSAGKSGAVKAKSRVDLSPRREEKRHEEKKEIEEVVDFRQVGSSEELGSFEPPRRPSGVGLVVGSRQPSVASSMRSSPRRTPSRVVASPRPTTISGLTSTQLDREAASKFF